MGAIAFIVDSATVGGRALDRTVGTLASSVIPTVTPPGNQPPVARWTYTCTAAYVCTFNGSTSSDPDGSIVSYQWRRANGTVLAAAATLTTTFAKASTIKLTLTVTDNGGLTNASTKTVVVA